MKLIKFLFKLIIILLVLVLIVVGIVFFTLSDSSDDVNLDLYTEDITTESVITPLLNTSLTKMKDEYALDLNLSSEDLNKLLYGVIKKSINPNYNPKNGQTDEEKYIYSDIKIPAETPVVGGKKLVVKHVYTNLENDEFSIYATCDAFSILKTKLTITLKIATTNNAYNLEITKLSLGKLDLRSGIGKTVYDYAVSNKIITEDSINNFIKDLPFTFDLKSLTLTSTKVDFANYIKQLVVKDDSGEATSAVVEDFIDIIVNPEKNNIDLKTSNSQLSLRINLEDLHVDDELTQVNESIKTQFDTELFIKNKVQTFAINAIASPGDKKMTFTEEEFARLIYNETNGYEDLYYSTNIIEGVAISFSVDGILVSITETKFNLSLILNINGLLTLAVINGDIVQVNDKLININLANTVTLGDNLQIDSGFIDNILAETMADNTTLPYDGDNHCFVVSADVFNNFVTEVATSAPLEVSKIKFIESALEIYVSVSDPAVSLLLDTVSATIESILESDFIDETQFNTTDESQAEAVNSLTSTLSDIATSISNPLTSLSSEQADSIVENINDLSPENQQIFLNQLQNQFMGNSALENLYSQLFPTE